ncbi:hypothetical protein T11_15002 [Trichinella zimbabwensis]|uniref:Uncharacterized protein n=1 Tax=Trichinella zimbabwensis TaxID=268475 RepID=A0A0V1HJQ2_9BILA|nr:hypothetical protein T11_15002 [Trichinella zimbabwensis]
MRLQLLVQVSKVIAQKGSSVKVGFSLVCYDCKENAKVKIVYSREARIEVVPLLFLFFFFFDYELGRHAAKLPCALLHYVIDASCCTSSIEISCCVRLRVEICVVHAENREMGCLICNATRTLILITSDVSFSRKEKIVLLAVSTERGKRLAGFLLLPQQYCKIELYS